MTEKEFDLKTEERTDNIIEILSESKINFKIKNKN